MPTCPKISSPRPPTFTEWPVGPCAMPCGPVRCARPGRRHKNPVRDSRPADRPVRHAAPGTPRSGSAVPLGGPPDLRPTRLRQDRRLSMARVKTSACRSRRFFNDTATTEIYTPSNTLSLHDALPICAVVTYRLVVTSLGGLRGLFNENTQFIKHTCTSPAGDGPSENIFTCCHCSNCAVCK